MKIDETTNDQGERMLTVKCPACPATLSFVVSTPKEESNAREHMTDAYRRHACKGRPS